ncbi:MAG: hypothetical protein WC246_03145 [Candidatus Paceibacterota bacterium]|jgi:hypothetical protein
MSVAVHEDEMRKREARLCLGRIDELREFHLDKQQQGRFLGKEFDSDLMDAIYALRTQYEKEERTGIRCTSQIRRGKVAIILLRHFLKRKLKVSEDLPREIGSISKELSIPASEIAELIEPIAREIVDGIFAKK